MRARLGIVDGAVKAGEMTGLPVMVDFGRINAVRNLNTLLLDKLRSGDIFTHCYSVTVRSYSTTASLILRWRRDGSEALSSISAWGRQLLLVRRSPCLCRGLLS